MTYKFQNDFSPVVRQPEIFYEKVVTRFTLAYPHSSQVIYGIIEKTEGNFVTIRKVPSNERYKINIDYIILQVNRRVVGVSYDMTANPYFNKVKYAFYDFTLQDTYSVAEAKKRVKIHEKPSLVVAQLWDYEYSPE